MALAHNLGFPRIGRDRELNKALERHRRGELDEAGLRQVGRELRAAHWRLQADAGLDLLPVGDFAWFDPVLTHSLMFGAIPSRFRAGQDEPSLDTQFAMAWELSPCSGGNTRPAGERGTWFDTHQHYVVPELTADQHFSLSWTQLFDEVDEALALGHRVKPMLIGPLTWLWLGRARDREFDRLDLLERLLPVYGQILERLAAQGVEWVQLDEPILALDLPPAWRSAFERAYHLLRAPVKTLVATCFGGLQANLNLAASLPVDGLHIDLVSAPEQFPLILDWLPGYKVLSLGVVNGRDVWPCDMEGTLALLQRAAERLGDRLWVAPSCSLQHAPVDLEDEARPDAELRGWQALAVQRCREVARLAEAMNRAEASGTLYESQQPSVAA